VVPQLRQTLQTRGGGDTPMPKAKVAFYDAKPYEIEAFNRWNRGEAVFVYIEDRLGPGSVDLAHGCNAVCLFVNDSCDEEVMKKLKEIGIEIIAMRCAGFDRVDLKTANDLGITVARVPAYSPYAVAEHAMALLLALNRKLNIAGQRVKTGDFTLDGLVGFDLHGKTCGVVGTGKIGQCFIDIVLGCGMEVLMYDVYQNPEYAAHPRCKYVELEEVFSQSDVVSIHLPLLPSTKHIVNAKTLGMMKKHAFLINVSRGGLVDTSALIEALKSDQIAGAGLDVYEFETPYFFADRSSKNIEDDQLARLLSLRNCILTGHQAFLTEEALQAISQTTLSNLKSFSAGQRMKDCLNSVNGDTMT